jgi:polysaccharide biosynthesis protein PslG
MKVLGVIAYSPKWAADPTCFATYGNKCPPLASSDFARYAAALAERYDGDGVNDAAGSPRVDAWEVWNEPNLASYWRPQPDPQAYTSLLASVYTAIHAAAPAVTVVSAGLSPAGGTYAPIKFLAAMYLDGAHGSFDALGFHPYSYPALPTKVASWNAWQQMFQAFPTVGQPDTLRSLMVANGDEAKKIWATEYGAPTAGDTNGDGVSNCDNDGVAAPGEDNCLTEAQQAVMVTTAYTQWRSYTWAGPLFWYAYQDLDTGSLNIEKNFGLVRSDGSQKPAYAVYTNAAYAALPAG